MATPFCPTCGTQVDEDARFCPACGTTLREDGAPDLPEAPPWPEASAEAESEQLTLPDDAPGDAPPDAPDDAPPDAADEMAEASAADRDEPQDEPHAVPPEPPAMSSEPVEPKPTPLPPSGAAEGPVAPAPRRDPDLPLTWPTTLSGWLIGGGAVLGAVALIASLSDAVSLLLMLALLGVAATVFLVDRLPAIPRLRLINLSVTMAGLGVALERAGFGARGADSVLLVAMIAAAGGALLIELDRDRPVSPPS
jgi:hypothetical protein